LEYCPNPTPYSYVVLPPDANAADYKVQ